MLITHAIWFTGTQNHTSTFYEHQKVVIVKISPIAYVILFITFGRMMQLPWLFHVDETIKISMKISQLFGTTISKGMKTEIIMRCRTLNILSKRLRKYDKCIERFRWICFRIVYLNNFIVQTILFCVNHWIAFHKKLIFMM